MGDMREDGEGEVPAARVPPRKTSDGERVVRM